MLLLPPSLETGCSKYIAASFHSTGDGDGCGCQLSDKCGGARIPASTGCRRRMATAFAPPPRGLACSSSGSAVFAAASPDRCSACSFGRRVTPTPLPPRSRRSAPRRRWRRSSVRRARTRTPRPERSHRGSDGNETRPCSGKCKIVPLPSLSMHQLRPDILIVFEEI